MHQKTVLIFSFLFIGIVVVAHVPLNSNKRLRTTPTTTEDPYPEVVSVHHLTLIYSRPNRDFGIVSINMIIRNIYYIDSKIFSSLIFFILQIPGR